MATRTFTVTDAYSARILDANDREFACLSLGIWGTSLRIYMPLVEYTYQPGDRITLEWGADGYVTHYRINDAPWIPIPQDLQHNDAGERQHRMDVWLTEGAASCQ